MILQPQEYFAIVRQLPDPNDSNTYYVRAVIRNARTDALIDTINLTDRGSRRFSQSWQTPADSSGLGFYISICTTVYTDSGYTAKSDVYAEEMETYLLDNRFRNLGGGAGGSDVDYKKIRTIFIEVLTTFNFSGMFEGIVRSIKDIDIKGIFTWLKSIDKTALSTENKVKEIASREVETIEPIDLTPLMEAIKANKPEKLDLSSILQAIKELSGLLTSMDFSTISKAYPELVTKASELHKSFSEINKNISGVDSQMKDFVYLMAKQGNSKSVETAKPNYTEIAGRIMGIQPK